jgi:hypothetical protein
MLEIIVLIFLTREIGRLALQKGLHKTRWKLYTVLGWIIAEVLGVIIGIMIFGKENIFSVVLVGLALAVTSYFMIKANLNKRPDADLDDDINKLGEQ